LFLIDSTTIRDDDAMTRQVIVGLQISSKWSKSFRFVAKMNGRGLKNRKKKKNGIRATRAAVAGEKSKIRGRLQNNTDVLFCFRAELCFSRLWEREKSDLVFEILQPKSN
ncbi:hypothetical protein RUM43_009358, partial [Polyplax serrata]